MKYNGTKYNLFIIFLAWNIFDDQPVNKRNEKASCTILTPSLYHNILYKHTTIIPCSFHTLYITIKTYYNLIIYILYHNQTSTIKHSKSTIYFFFDLLDQVCKDILGVFRKVRILMRQAMPSLYYERF